MQFKKTTISLLFCAWFSHLAAQQPDEPQYIDQYNAVKAGQLVALERQTSTVDTKSRRNFVITPNTKVFESIPGTASPIRLSPNAHFIVKLPTGGRDPQTLVHLEKLTVSKKDRQILIVTYKQSLVPFGGVKHDRAADPSIPVTITKYGNSSLEVAPANQLEPGEYAFTEGHAAQCFGVDAETGRDSSAAPESAMPAATAPAPAPHSQIPTHPASSVVDLPPAAPGYPPLHASAPAQEGCWWVPFVAQKLSLEMLVENCEPGKWMGGGVTRFIAGNDSISALADGTSDAVELFTIHTKPATQSILAAIQQQFISKLQAPAARASCKAVRDTPAATGEIYEVQATGPYSKRKEFAGTDGPGESACPGISSDDVTGRSFLYLPQDSKTKFIFFQIQEIWPFDQRSIRLHPD